MEDVLVWLFWAVIIGGSIASSAKKAKKQREEEARKAAAAKAAKARAATSQPATVARPAAMTTSQSVTRQNASGQPGQGSKAGGTFGKVLEELSRQLTEQPSPPVAEGRKTVSWPSTASQPQTRTQPQTRNQPQVQPVATSFDYRSLEEEYRGDWSAESMEDEVAAYERLAEQRAVRSSLVPAAAATGTLNVAAVQDMAADSDDDDHRHTKIHELLGGDFDLRRAVIESEILTPKYAAGY